MLRTLHLPVRASCPPFPSCQRRSHPGSLMPGLNPAWHCQASAAFAISRTAGHRRWGIKSCPSQTPPVPPGSAWPRDVTNCIPASLTAAASVSPLQKAGTPSKWGSPRLRRAGSDRAGSASLQSKATSRGHSAQGNAGWKQQAVPCLPLRSGNAELSRISRHQMKPLKWRIRQDIKSLAFISGHNMFSKTLLQVPEYPPDLAGSKCLPPPRSRFNYNISGWLGNWMPPGSTCAGQTLPG